MNEIEYKRKLNRLDSDKIQLDKRIDDEKKKIEIIKKRIELLVQRRNSLKKKIQHYKDRRKKN